MKSQAGPPDGGEEPLPVGTVAPPAEPPPRLRRRRRVLLAVTAAAVLLGAVALAGVLVLDRDAPPPVWLSFVAGLGGPDAESSADMLRGVELLLAEVNRSGGVDGHRVELRVHDDRDDPGLAREQAEEIARDQRILGVIGHRTSGASLAAGPVYAGGGIPVITPTSTADAVTRDNPWFFRMVFTNSAEGRFISTYLRNVLGERAITVIAGTDDYGKTLSEGVIAGWPGPDAARVVTLDTSGDLSPAAVAEVVAGATSGNRGTVVLALPEQAARQVVLALRASGYRGRLFGGDTAGSEEFFQQVSAGRADESPEEPTDNLYAVAPLINDALSGDGVRWYSAFVAAYGKPPSWRAATAYQSALALVHALRTARLELRPGSIDEDRRAVLRRLAGIDSPGESLHGIIGPVWFDGQRTAVMPVNVGLGRGGHFVSAFDQLQPALVPADAAPDEQPAGLVTGVNGTPYQRRRVATVGVKINQISEFATEAETFEADFFLWIKFSGDDDVTDIAFPNAADPDLALGPAVRSSVDGDVSYRLYRVRGRFKTSLQFHDFPFDRQRLSIDVQNRSLPSSSVVYAADVEVIHAPQEERLTSGANAAEPVLAVSDWEADRLDYYQATVGASTALGDPLLRGGQAGLSYSRFVTELTISRVVRPFLVKNLLPLLLLAAATYASLFFSHSQTAERVTFGITGILTGAVLLVEVTASLPSIGYTVAIQWGYYIFILLAAGCVLVGIVGGRYYDRGSTTAIWRLDVTSQIVYPLVCVGTVLAYAMAYD